MQKTSITIYIAEFLRIVSYLQYIDVIFKNQFYSGLKETVKNRICTLKRSANLNDFVIQIVKMDERLFEYQ